jgi:hypothetical protein
MATRPGVGKVTQAPKKELAYDMQVIFQFACWSGVCGLFDASIEVLDLNSRMDPSYKG